MNDELSIVVIGSLLYDCVIWGDRFPETGETILGQRNGYFTGGKGANQAVQIARLGTKVHMIGCVGRDDPGDILLNTLSSFCVDTTYIDVLSHVPTGSDCIHVDANGDNRIMIAPLANQHLSRKTVDRALPIFQKSKVFLTQLETNLDMVLYGLKRAKQSGLITIFNPAPAIPIPDEMLSYADYVTPNETETRLLTGVLPEADDISACHEAARRLQCRGAGNVLITLGKAGAYYNISGQTGIIPPFKVKAVDTTAAGDSFNGAFAVCLANGWDPVKAVRYACAAGALTASRPGAQQSMGTREEIERLIREQCSPDLQGGNP